MGAARKYHSIPAGKPAPLFFCFTGHEISRLMAVRKARRFPIARFELHCSQEPELRITALNHVCLTSPEDSMEAVKARAAVLESLQKKGLVRISYSLPAYVQSDYRIFYQSQIYELLCHTAMEAQGQPDFLFDLPAMRFGQVFPL